MSLNLSFNGRLQHFFLTHFVVIAVFVFSVVSTAVFAESSSINSSYKNSLNTLSSKQIVGATEIVWIKEAELYFKARVDTGAKTTSIHAENIQVDADLVLHDSATQEQRAALISQPIEFDVVNQIGERQHIKTQVLSVVKVKTSDHSEYRYVVPLTIGLKGQEKQVAVSLNNRSQVKYRLLLGRNWLTGDYLVDVDLNTAD